jgi:hypothetical protein
MQENYIDHNFFSEKDKALQPDSLYEYYGDIVVNSEHIQPIDQYKKLALSEIKLMSKRGNQIDDLKLSIDHVLKTILPVVGDRDVSREIQHSIQLIGDLTFAKITDNPNSKSKEQLFLETLKAQLFNKNKAEIVVDYGGSESDVNIRIFSYLIPALENLRLYSDNKIEVPTLRVVNARAASTRLNGLSPELTLKNQMATSEWLQKFVNTFYSDVAGKVMFTAPTEDVIFNNILSYAKLKYGSIFNFKLLQLNF